MHLIIDGFGANRKMLESEDMIYDLLDRYPSQIGMTKSMRSRSSRPYSNSTRFRNTSSTGVWNTPMWK